MSEGIDNSIEANAGARFVSDGNDFVFLSERRACIDCKHKTPDENTCKAFPGRIPKEILRGENDHSKPFSGDNGIVFEAK